MKRFLFAAALVVFTASLQANETKLTPIQFNDRLTAITDSLYARGQEWGKAFNAANKSRNYASLRTSREALSRYVNSKILYVTNMKDVSTSRPLRMAMIGFLRFESNMVDRAFKPLESFDAQSSAEDINTALTNLTNFSTEENAELQKVAAAQEIYAKENGFTIESASEADERKG